MRCNEVRKVVIVRTTSVVSSCGSEAHALLRCLIVINAGAMILGIILLAISSTREILQHAWRTGTKA